MLGSDGRIILIDFGAANEFIESATGTLIGKQSYISPEQFRGKAGPGSDIYSLGGTLHFLLIGQDPIPLAPTHPSQCNPEIPLNLDMLVAACTAQELRDRPLSAAEVVEQLNKLGDTNVGNVTC
jgi:serine/threonine protein kinase